MGNFAFSSLVILLLATPGYVARSAYLSRSFTSEVLPKNLMDDIARAILYSLPFHLLGIASVEHLHLWGFLESGINFEILFRLISGDYGPSSDALPTITGNLYRHVHPIGLYFGILVGVAFVTGKKLRDIVWNRQWDVKYPSIFGYRNKWLYTLFGRGKGTSKNPGSPLLSYVDAIVEMGEKTRIYRGVVYEFTTDDTGTLKDIVLIETLRGKFKDLEDGKQEFYWEKIPGNFFILKYSETKNLNVTFYPSDPLESASPPQEEGKIAESAPTSPPASTSPQSP